MSDLKKGSSKSRRGDQLLEVCDKLLAKTGQILEEIKDYKISKDEQFLFQHLLTYSRARPGNSIQIKQFMNEKVMDDSSKNLSPLGTLYFTDRYKISDDLFFAFYDYHYLNGVLTSINQLEDERKKMNEMIIKDFVVTASSDHISCDLDKFLGELVSLISIIEGKIPDKLDLKSFFDGRPGNNVIHALVLLGTSLSSQSRENVFITDMFKGKETYESFSEYFHFTFSRLDKINETNCFAYKYEKDGIMVTKDIQNANICVS